MGARQLPDRFLVAFSFAGEQRELVSSVATEVEQRLGEPNVFYDEWWEHYLAGGDADLKLQAVYDQAALVVVCVSERYGNKEWTGAEHEAIRARQMKARVAAVESEKLGVLPVRVGDGDVPGILFNTIVPDLRMMSHVDAAALVIDRLGLVGGHDDGTLAARLSSDHRTHRVEVGDRLDRLAARYLGTPSDWRRIASLNRMADPMALRPGQLLAIPPPKTDDAGH